MLIVMHCVFFFFLFSGISSDALKVSSAGTGPQVVK